MNNLLIICKLGFLMFGLVYGNECNKKTEKDMGCPIYKIESKDDCQTYLSINEGEHDFVFYINPLNKGRLSISLHKRYAEGHSSTEITNNLFSLQIKDINKWQKITIRRGKIRKAVCLFQCFINTYYLDIDDKPHFYIDKNIEAGNEIRVQTVTSRWSISCDPRHQQSTPHPLSQLATESIPSIQPSSRTPKSLQDGNIGILKIITDHIPVWQLALISSATLLLILVAVLVAVTMVLTHKRTKLGPVLIQPTDHQSRLSRYVSENSLYASYDNPCTIVNTIQSEVVPSTGTEWNRSVSCEGKGPGVFENQSRGSAHNSENSLYMGFG